MEAYLIQPGAVGNTAESTPATASTSAQTEELSGVFASELEHAIQSEGTQSGDSTEVQAGNSTLAEVAEPSTDETAAQNLPITNVLVEDPTALQTASDLTELRESEPDGEELEIGTSSAEEPTAEDALDEDAGLSHLSQVDQNTSRHFSTLENVLSRVPESAKPAIEHALQVSAKGNETVMGSLEAQEGTPSSEPVIDGTIGESKSLVEGALPKLAATTETATSVLEQARTRVAAPGETAVEGALQAVRGDGASNEVAATVLEEVHSKVGEQAKPAIESAPASRGQGTEAANATPLQAVRGDGASNEVAATVLEEVHNKVGEQAKPAIESALASRGQGTEAANANAENPGAITASTSTSGKDSNTPAPQSSDADTSTADDGLSSPQTLRSGVPLQAKSSHQGESPLPDGLQKSANSENASQAIPSTSQGNQGEKASTDGPSLPDQAAVPERVELPFENAPIITPNLGEGNSTSQARRGSGQDESHADLGTEESAGSLEVDPETSQDTSQTRKNELPGAQRFVVPASNSAGSQGEPSLNSGEQSSLTALADLSGKSPQARSLNGTAREAGSSTTNLEQAAPPEFNLHNQMGRIVNSARVMEQLGRAEMHVSLRTEAMGPVEFHTVVRNGEVDAVIGAERHEARVALTSQLPALEQALTDRSLRVDNLTVSDRSGGAQSGFSQSSNSDANPFARQHGSPSRWPWAMTAEGISAVTLEGWDLGEGPGRLSVHV